MRTQHVAVSPTAAAVVDPFPPANTRRSAAPSLRHRPTLLLLPSLLAPPSSPLLHAVLPLVALAHLLLFNLVAVVAAAAVVVQPPHHTPECEKAYGECETATDCVHRLAALQSTCVTNTCQPQCRDAALNLYQNREGRALLRTDTSCVPGRYEMEKCGLLPNRAPKHCGFAKLICETDMECNARWEVFASECDLYANGNELSLMVVGGQQRCSEKCQRHLNETLGTQHGAAFQTCTCTGKEDERCELLREQLKACLAPHKTAPTSKETSEELPLPRPPPIHSSDGDKNGDENNTNNVPFTSNEVSGNNLPDDGGNSLGGHDVPSTTDSAAGLGIARIVVVLSVVVAFVSVCAAKKLFIC